MNRINTCLITLVIIFAALFWTSARAAPIDGMIGKTLPQFLVYMPFTQEVTSCMGETSFTIMARHYIYEDVRAGEMVDIRTDLFLGSVIVGHWLEGIKKYLGLDKDGKVVRITTFERFYPSQQCNVTREYIARLEDG